MDLDFFSTQVLAFVHFIYQTNKQEQQNQMEGTNDSINLLPGVISPLFSYINSYSAGFSRPLLKCFAVFNQILNIN